MSNRFMFSEKTLYTFSEACSVFLSYTMSPHPSFPFHERDDVLKCLLSIEYVVYDGLNHKFTKDYNGLSFIYADEDTYLSCRENAVLLLNKLKLRYGEHFALVCDTDEQTEEVAKAKQLFTKIFNMLDYSFPKYDELLSLYASEKSHLLDQLGRTRSGSRSISQTGQNVENSKTIFNDTPQTSDVVATMEDNQHASELTKGQVAGSSNSTGSDSFQEAELWDNATIMSRLSEIESKFTEIWKKWLDEFDQLFIEEVNY